MILSYCPVQMYMKEKPDNFCVGLFIMEYSKQYLIYNFYVYQVYNWVNVDVHTMARGLPTTPKGTANDKVKIQNLNDSKGRRWMFLENKYAYPQLLAIMNSKWNIKAVKTWKQNRIGF